MHYNPNQEPWRTFEGDQSNDSTTWKYFEAHKLLNMALKWDHKLKEQ